MNSLVIGYISLTVLFAITQKDLSIVNAASTYDLSNSNSNSSVVAEQVAEEQVTDEPIDTSPSGNATSLLAIDAYWVPTSVNKGIPPNAVRVGVDLTGAPVYIGRALHEGGVYVVKYTPRRKQAVLVSDGQVIEKTNFDVLTGRNFKWVASSFGDYVENAVRGCRTSTGEDLYIGRRNNLGSIVPGQVQPSMGSITFSFANAVFEYFAYDVLVYL